MGMRLGSCRGTCTSTKSPSGQSCPTQHEWNKASTRAAYAGHRNACPVQLVVVSVCMKDRGPTNQLPAQVGKTLIFVHLGKART